MSDVEQAEGPDFLLLHPLLKNIHLLHQCELEKFVNFVSDAK